MSKWTRREFLKATGLGAGALWALELGFDLSAAEAKAHELKISGAKEFASVCPFCSIGCGVIISVKNGKVINIEGNPDSPLNEGALCSKGAALLQEANNERRLTKPKYRAPGSKEWKEISWEDALGKIAQKVKATRDSTFQHKLPDGTIVNRTEAIAHFGSAALTNEENYLLVKLMRNLGVTYIEHQARI